MATKIFMVIGTIIIGAVMLWRVIDYLNSDRKSEGKAPMGCIATIIVIIIVIAFWYITSNLV